MLLDRVAPRRRARARPASWCLLADQDRARWDRALIAEGQALVRALPAPRPARPVPDPGRDQRRPQRRARAHRLAADPRALRPAAGARPDPGRRAQPRGRGGRGRRPGRRRSPLVDALDLDGYHLFHAVRADLLRRLGRDDEAAAAYEAAIARTRERGRARLPRGPARGRAAARPAAGRAGRAWRGADLGQACSHSSMARMTPSSSPRPLSRRMLNRQAVFQNRSAPQDALRRARAPARAGPSANASSAAS